MLRCFLASVFAIIAAAAPEAPCIDPSPSSFDDWPFGLKKRTGCAEGVSDDQLKQQLATLPLVFPKP